MARGIGSISTPASSPLEQIAVGLIVAADGRLLLQHRDAKPGVPVASLWGFFGGHVEPGEPVSAAFLRELREELDWQPRHFEHYATREVPSLPGAEPEGRVVSYVFAAHLNVPLEALSLGEGQAMALFAPHALPDALVPGLRGFIEDFAQSDAYKRVKRQWAGISAGALIVDARGDFLLQLRDDKPEITNPGLWGSFGGSLELHETSNPETPDQGLVRELSEELAWEPRDFTLFLSAPYRTDPNVRHDLIYVYAVPLDVPADSLVLGEGQALGFFAPDALPEQIIAPLRDLIVRFAGSDLYRDTMRKAM